MGGKIIVEYISKDKLKRKKVYHFKTKGGAFPKSEPFVKLDDISNIPAADVVGKEMILDFIEDNRPTDVQTDWERGCAYICDEITKLLSKH